VPILSPFTFEESFTPQEFQKLGQFASRWALIEHIIGNCLRAILEMSPEHATVMIFPLSLDARMQRIEEVTQRFPLKPEQATLYADLKPLIRAQQYLRNTALHGVVIGGEGESDPLMFHLRSKNRNVLKADLLGCEDLINYTAHVVQAFRLSLGGKDGLLPQPFALPDRPPIPAFLPNDCRKFPQRGTA
jgi:hypothetical protein